MHPRFPTTAAHSGSRGSAASFFGLGVALFCMLPGLAVAQVPDAASLRARYDALDKKLAHNQFQRPIYLESSEDSGQLKGDVFAVMEQPYTVVGPALKRMDHWCDILILHLNVKSCLVSPHKAGDTLSLRVGRKFDRPLKDAYRFEFLYDVVTDTTDYLQVLLHADDGPLDTRGYRIVLEVMKLDAERSFLHLSYALDYGIVSRVAMQGYLATIGRDKVGFSIVGSQADGQPVYLRGMRGVIERNTMRYYVAIEAYLDALSAPAPEQIERRLNAWFAGIERYPVQLHELERDEYLGMKRKEIQRQQAGENGATGD